MISVDPTTLKQFKAQEKLTQVHSTDPNLENTEVLERSQRFSSGSFWDDENDNDDDIQEWLFRMYQALC